MPFLQGTMFRFSQMDPLADNFSQEMLRLCKADPMLALFLLRLANSGRGAKNQPVTTINDALRKVRPQRLFHLIDSASVTRIFSPSKPEYKGLWQHSIETAVFAEFSARKIEGFSVPPALAYNAGFIHDIGRFLFLEHTPQTLDDTEKVGWTTPMELPDLERMLLGLDHAELGYRAAEKWGLPNILQRMLRHHHHYGLWLDSNFPKLLRELVVIVQFADFVSVLVEKDPDWVDWKPAALREAIQHRCVHPSWEDVHLPVAEMADKLPALNRVCQERLALIGL